MAKLIIGFTGEKLSGKGTAACYLADQHQASVHRFSTPMRDCLKRLHIPISRENLIRFSEITREAYSEDLYAKTIAGDSAADEAKIVVIDGIRREADMSALKVLPEFHLVYITAPAEMRYERMKKRGENEGETAMSWEGFLEEEKASTELEIPELGKSAEFRIDNTGSFEDLHKNLEGIISKLDSRSSRE